MPPPLEALLSRLTLAHELYELPIALGAESELFASECLGLFFPHCRVTTHADAQSLAATASRIRTQLEVLVGDLKTIAGQPLQAEQVADEFLARLPAVYDSLLLDAEAHYQGDPAARSVDEVVLAYPGFRAVALYRIANALHKIGVPLLPRLITEQAHRDTGIDIHPGATIGRAISIDHGTGVVVGETTVIGHRVKLYQGVTLGAASVSKDLTNIKRHPTIGDDVVIYANATILGGDTVIGAGSIIGGNVWLTHSVPAGSIVTHDRITERPRSAADDALLVYYP